LDPDDLLQVRIAGDRLRELLLREGIEQLRPGDGDGLDLRALRRRVDVVVDLAAAEDQALDLLLAVLRQRIVEDEMERAIGEVLEGRGRPRQQAGVALANELAAGLGCFGLRDTNADTNVVVSLGAWSGNRITCA